MDDVSAPKPFCAAWRLAPAGAYRWPPVTNLYDAASSPRRSADVDYLAMTLLELPRVTLQRADRRSVIATPGGSYEVRP